MAAYGGWVTLGDSSPKPPEKSGSWLKPIHLTKSDKSELLLGLAHGLPEQSQAIPVHSAPCILRTLKGILEGYPDLSGLGVQRHSKSTMRVNGIIPW